MASFGWLSFQVKGLGLEEDFIHAPFLFEMLLYIYGMHYAIKFFLVLQLNSVFFSHNIDLKENVTL